MATKKEDETYIKDVKVQYGEPVGVVAAQSMGEPSTQMVLRTFHSAGIATTISSGLPRVIELVDARKKQASPTMTVQLEPKIRKDYDAVKKLAKKFQEIRIRDVILKHIENLKESKLELVLSKSKMEDNLLTEEMVIEKLNKKFSGISIEKKSNHLIISQKKPKDIHSTRIAFVHIMDFQLSGIKGINKAVIMQNDDESFYIFTSGSNISEAMQLDGVVPEKIYSTDPFDVLKSYGVEAARNAIAYELRNTMQHEGVKVDFRHMGLIADSMTLTGTIIGVGRHGLAGTKASVFARAAYEETVKHFVNASIFGESDLLKGVSENVLIGKQIHVGTGLVKLAIKKDDLKKIKAEE
ncbi:DNA-directed RNA polymerase subunit A'' [Candidatus Mancarchaeum acidiphilum]|uniref:DNA-directed RNA polymerase n=1 Tax=Candidatus Mancarchaeum acidiphilum TaxID=1920749 RepID=A0A218NM84_9ARCH|nr:DNA-directed RNA polymerase subunit A'' [Candidatus Mancarchaeum acidiphilum]ASI13574.1 DNA-directed RNA polymerase subunit A'' [Candidatus Mancarchaeum acidiphilum]